MTFRLKIDCNNAAFEEPTAEVARLLREAADNLEHGNDNGVILDYNGNVVGEHGFSTRVRRRK